jgi:hypothetical protein
MLWSFLTDGTLNRQVPLALHGFNRIGMRAAHANLLCSCLVEAVCVATKVHCVTTAPANLIDLLHSLPHCAGHCLCTQPNCRDSQNKPMCAAPKLPSEYPPPASPPPVPSPGPDPQQPAAVRQPDGSCSVLPGSHFTLDVSTLPLHPDSR